MKTSAARTSETPRRTELREAPDDAWRARAGQLFTEFERAARSMLNRAFRGAFSHDEIEDIYANAWLGTLRALAGRHSRLSDEEIRSYLLTAVANQASKELRRRRRKPTAPLESAPSVPDTGSSPEDRVASAERSRVTRDLLASLPKRRRAVILLRYGWGLEPRQVCGLVKGLSPRAYRKEITRGVDELAQKLRLLERGEWCADREPVLKAYVAGLADADEVRQAKAHMAHCRDCSEFVARLSGHLHDLGSALAVPATLDAVGVEPSLVGRATEWLDHGRESVVGLFARGASPAADSAAAGVGTTGGMRGAGAAGAGVVAKLAGIGAAGKAAVACLGGGVAATACVAAGIGPLDLSGGGAESSAAAPAKAEKRHPRNAAAPAVELLPSQLGNEAPPPKPTSPPPAEPQGQAPAEGQSQGEPETQPAPAPAPAPVAASAPPLEQEFGAAAAAAPAPTGGGGGASGGSGGGGAAPVRQEFAP